MKYGYFCFTSSLPIKTVKIACINVYKLFLAYEIIMILIQKVLIYSIFYSVNLFQLKLSKFKLFYIINFLQNVSVINFIK